MAGVLMTAGALLCGPPVSAAAPAQAGGEVVVVYNSRMPESRMVAEHYAWSRHVPSDRMVGLDLPVDESMTRDQYVEKLQNPLLVRLEKAGLFVFGPATNRPPAGSVADTPFRRLIQSRIRYAVLCYGVPTRILKDASLPEPAAMRLPPQLQRNEAAVDTQLALLPVTEQRLPWTGPIQSPFYGATNSAVFQPTNGILLVARLDGPSAEIARGLVDKAMEAETNGWWGRAYFDARGLATNDSYRLGDDYIRSAAIVAQRFGFETELDEQPGTFTVGHPMSEVGLYAGWYDQTLSGPFTLPSFTFMPGAFAYHLYSFSAQTVRSTNNSWVGTLLQRGATCTLGYVDEPYLDGTVDLGTLLSRLTFLGFSFGEAAYAAQRSLSWQTTVIGDPLYTPGFTNLGELHRTLELRKSPLLGWSHLLVINRNLSLGAPLDQMIHYIETSTPYRQSALLTEKLGDLYWLKGGLGDGVDTTEMALRRDPSPAQRVRLLLKCAERRATYGPDDKAYGHYLALLKEFPGYPDPLKVYKAMLALARRMNNAAEIARCESEIEKRSPAPARQVGETSRP